MNNKLYVLFFLSLISINIYAANWQAQAIKHLNGGSAIVQNPSGQIIFSHNAEQLMVPASILKIATADAVITHLGTDYRINTEFYLTRDNYLGIKGFGDPTLVSESLALIARQLKISMAKQAIKGNDLKGFLLDSSFFKPLLEVDGQSKSNNPYDSSVGPLLANFNTINVYKSKNGKISSAESQTPLTATAIQLAKKLSPGKHRINIGQDNDLALRYFTELLQFFLKREGINIPLRIINQVIPDDSIKLLVHQSQPVSDIIRKLFLFSNNLIANQLLIVLGGVQKGAPADLDKGKQVVAEFLLNEIGLAHFTLQEGSGLSRKNQFTATQMMKLLVHFKPYQYLLRIDNKRFQAKTGTLKGVSSYAGYFISPLDKSYPFVIMINRANWKYHRKKVANILYQGIFID